MPRCSGGPDEQRPALVGFGSCESPLEKLPHDAKREVRLKFGPARAQNLVAKLSRQPARRLNQRSLAEADPSLDCQNAAAATK